MRSALPYGVTTGSAAAAPSPELWHLCPTEAIMAGRIRGWSVWEDFIVFPDLSGTDSNLHKWSSFGDTGSVIRQVGNEVGGVLQVTSDGDGENASIELSESGGFLKLDANHRVWFEARYKFDTIADTKLGAFIGLHEPIVQSTSVPLNGGNLNDQDFVGFFHDEDDGDQIDLVFNKAAAGAVTTAKADAKTLVADTYIKSGFVWDPTNRAAEWLTWYFDGSPVPSSSLTVKGSKAKTANDTTKFPGGEEMGIIAAVEMAAVGSPSLFIDWIKCAAMPIT